MPAGATSQYVYTPVIHPGEMMYQPAQYQPTDLTDASMIEAAAPPAEVHFFIIIQQLQCTLYKSRCIVRRCNIASSYI